jgi:protein TonB
MLRPPLPEPEPVVEPEPLPEPQPLAEPGPLAEPDPLALAEIGVVLVPEERLPEPEELLPEPVLGVELAVGVVLAEPDQPKPDPPVPGADPLTREEVRGAKPAPVEIKPAGP